MTLPRPLSLVPLVCLLLAMLCGQVLGQQVLYAETFESYAEGSLAGQNYWFISSGTSGGQIMNTGAGKSLGRTRSGAITDRYVRIDPGTNTEATFSVDVRKAVSTTAVYALAGFVDDTSVLTGVVFGLSTTRLVFRDGISSGTAVNLTDQDGTEIETATNVWYRITAHINVAGSSISSVTLQDLTAGTAAQQVYFGAGNGTRAFSSPLVNWSLVRTRVPSSATVDAWIDNLKLTVPQTVADTNFDWSTATQLHTGILHKALSVSSPRPMKINALRVDLRSPNIRLAHSPRAANWSANSTESPVYTTRRFIETSRQRGLNMLVAINGAPFAYNSLNPEGTEVNVKGLALDRGDFVSAVEVNYDRCLLYDRAWEARIEQIPLDFDSSNILTAVTGFGSALQSGAPVGSTAFSEYPQTAVGVSEDGRYLVMMTIDGRQTGYSEGATVRETGGYLRFFGAFMGLWLDGGGSTTMATYSPSGNNVQLLNRPSDRNLFGQVVERRNGSNLGVYAITTPELITMDDWLKFRGVPQASRGALDVPIAGGLPNLLAYAMNVHPMRGASLADTNAMPAFSLATGPGNARFLEYRFRANEHATNLVLGVEASGTLLPGSWNVPGGLTTEALGPDPLTGDPLYRARLALGTSQRSFLRLKATGN